MPLVMDTNLYLSLLAAAGMVFVAAAFVLGWARLTGLSTRWCWVGAALWLLGFLLKQAVAPWDAQVFQWVARRIPPASFSGGLYVGLSCSLCEMGITLAAVRVWRRLGNDAPSAIGIGVGAGAFEACFLALFAAARALRSLLAGEAAAGDRAQIDASAQLTALFWLVPAVERTTAVLGHAATRAMVLLGAAHRVPWLVFSGFALFAAADAAVTIVHLLGLVEKRSLWWLEAVHAPFGLISILILGRCMSRWGPESART